MSKIILFSISVLFIILLSYNEKNKQSKDNANRSTVNDTVENKSKSPADKINKDLVSIDLNSISSLTINGKTDFFENGSPLTKYLAIELIDKSLFEGKKNTSVNFFLADTTNIKKKNGVIELACKNKVVKYTDITSDNDGMQTFTYAGQFIFLNKYVVAGSYYEGGDYLFVDKTTGIETNTFVDFPYVSPDKKNIICIYSNGYESTADLELYTISGTKVIPIISASFKNWMPLAENNEMFWSSDGYLYLNVHQAKTFWKENGQLNDHYQYIRLKVL